VYNLNNIRGITYHWQYKLKIAVAVQSVVISYLFVQPLFWNIIWRLAIVVTNIQALCIGHLNG